MSEKKQTAVRWLIEHQSNMPNLLHGNITLEEYQRVKDDIINKALQMEREQIEEAYKCGKIPAMFSFNTPTANEYYTDTYGE